MTTGAGESSLAEQAYRHIVDRLFSASLRAGEFIDRRRLAEELQISRRPVDDAMTKLEFEGVVETFPRKGTRVRLISLEDVRGQLQVREALETQAARTYCGNRVRGARSRLYDLTHALGESGIAMVERYRRDQLIHKELVSLAGYPALDVAFQRTCTLSLFLSIHRAIFAGPDVSPSPPEVLVKLHSGLIDSLCDAGPIEADELIRAHVRRARQALFDDRTPSGM